MSAETDYIAYLETKVCDQAFRIGELEAALLYILNYKDTGHSSYQAYIKASRVLWHNMVLGLETAEKYKELVNG